MNSELKRVYEVYEASDKIYFDSPSSYVLMSDCHRGTGSLNDDFYKNKDIYLQALNHYYSKDYIYIEIGDGDELWENDSFQEIIDTHRDSFNILSKFNRENRLYLIYGNHDVVKRDPWVVRNYLVPVLGDVKIHEGLILSMRDSDIELFLIHGHQVDFFNDKLWKISRFLVRYLWGPLQMLGIMNPGNTAFSFSRKKTIDIKLMDWCKLENKGLIAGHTHKFMYPQKGKVPYFNTGCCVYPEGITAIEIDNGNITLVRWFSKIENDTTVFNREVIGGPEMLQYYFTIE